MVERAIIVSFVMKNLKKIRNRKTYPADTDKASTATAIQPPMNDVILKIKPIDLVKQ